jgi:hypothetical protein
LETPEGQMSAQLRLRQEEQAEKEERGEGEKLVKGDESSFQGIM